MQDYTVRCSECSLLLMADEYEHHMETEHNMPWMRLEQTEEYKQALEA